MPGLLAEHLKATDVAEIREALRGGRTIRRGQGYSVRVTAPPALYQAVLKQCAALADDGSPGRAPGVPHLRRPDRHDDEEGVTAADHAYEADGSVTDTRRAM
ncbi:hypothetical protein [Streptomyces olivaceus]|uniref:hypothetical protein n=1 Tax=Streptomyces olivaceus TaxID=47716 RepID=UPI0036BB9EE9